MIQSGLHGNMQSAAEMSAPGESASDAVTRRVTITNGPKVNKALALVKLGYMLEYLVYPTVREVA